MIQNMTEANHQQQQQQQQHLNMMIEQQEQQSEVNTTVVVSSSSILVWQTMIREVLLQPYLPPPVIRFIHMIDTLLYDMYGISEATVTILFTLLIAYIIRYMIQILLLIVSKRHGRAIKDDDTDNDTMMKKEKQNADYDTTVVFTGPRNSGKTTLFYQFVYNMENSTTTGTSSNNTSDTKHLLPTVMSLRPNIGYVINEIVDNMNHDISDNTNNNNNQQQHHHHHHHLKIRCIDYPGYMNIYDTTYSKFINSNHPVSSSSTQTQPPTRIVLVVDATQSVTSSAEILFHLFTILYNSYCINTAMNMKSSIRLQPAPLPMIQKSSIFVACHKQDHSKAKNEKRIKIQLRTELERLIYNTTVQQQQMNKAAVQHDTTNDINNKATTVATNHEYWWNCTKSTRNSNTNSSSSTTTSAITNNNTKSLQLQFTINVDFDELDFIETIYFYPTSSSSSSTKELFEFCTTGMVQQQ